ncbi:dihydrofolate reductase family protein [soil metagenome]
MSKITCQISMSLDGFIAGPNQSVDNPIGEGGMRLHEWALATSTWREQHGEEGGESNVDAQVAEAGMEGIGAFVMGRKMFGGGDGEWDLDWKGWWGDDPPYHAPVYVLTHHERERLEMEGGTTFHFVTDGLESALAKARESAGDADISIAGGASLVRQCLAAGHLDELHLHIAPVLLGSGERIFDDVGEPALELIETIAGERTTHVRYRVRP